MERAGRRVRVGSVGGSGSHFVGKKKKKRESITHSAPLPLPVVIVLGDDSLLFQASIKATLLFHMSAGRADPAPLAAPAAFYEERTGSQQASSLSSINEEEKEGARRGEGGCKQRLKELFRFPPPPPSKEY